MKFKIFAVMAFVAIISWVVPSGLSAQTREELIEGAKKEGRVVWYGSLSLEDLRKLANAFEKKYPFIKVETFRASGEKVANKIMTEVRAGRYLFDVVATGAFEIWPLQKRRMLGKYISPESKAYGAKFKAADGSWNDLYDNYYVIGWNTNMVSPQESPKDWPDMLAEKWKGKIAIDSEDYEWYMAMLNSMGEEKGRAFMKRLAKQDIQWRKGHTLIAQTMVAGEFPTALIYAHRAEKMKPLGAPIDWGDTFDPIVSGMRVVSIGAKTPNPNAAKLLYDYVISKEGQKLIGSMGRIPAHPDVDPLSPKLDPKKLKLHPAAPDLAERAADDMKEFREIFNIH